MELVEILKERLAVTEEQAGGGAGLLLSLAKKKLGEQDFDKLLKAIPGIDELISKASSGKAGGMLGGIAKRLLGQGAGNLAGLAAGFKKLGLEGDMISKFVPVILSFVQSKGGDALKELLEKALT
jgi:hypothetical protein